MRKHDWVKTELGEDIVRKSTTSRRVRGRQDPGRRRGRDQGLNGGFLQLTTLVHRYGRRRRERARGTT